MTLVFHLEGMTNNSGLQQLLIYINKNINAQLSFSFV